MRKTAKQLPLRFDIKTIQNALNRQTFWKATRTRLQLRGIQPQKREKVGNKNSMFLLLITK